MIVVIDTNVLASAFICPGSTPNRLLTLWLGGAFTLAVSEHILAERQRTLGRPYFANQLTPGDVAANLRLIRQASLVELTAIVAGAATYPEDDLILATAVSAAADYLVTGDRQLLRLDEYKRVQNVSPRAFLDLLDA